MKKEKKNFDSISSGFFKKKQNQLINQSVNPQVPVVAL